jgi:hypothetical protein
VETLKKGKLEVKGDGKLLNIWFTVHDDDLKEIDPAFTKEDVFLDIVVRDNYSLKEIANIHVGSENTSKGYGCKEAKKRIDGSEIGFYACIDTSAAPPRNDGSLQLQWSVAMPLSHGNHRIALDDDLFDGAK